MNFWNKPENNPVKVLLLVIILAVAGYFVFRYVHIDPLGGKGSVGEMQSAKISQGLPIGQDGAFTVMTGSAISSPCCTTGGYTIAGINGSITALGGTNATTIGFNIGNTTAYTSPTPSVTGSFGVGNFHVMLSNIVCEMPYHYRAFAERGTTVAYGPDKTFVGGKCPPDGGTGAISSGAGPLSLHFPADDIPLQVDFTGPVDDDQNP